MGNNMNNQEIIKVEGQEKAVVKTKPRIIIGTLNIFMNPARNRFHKFYHPKKNRHWHWHMIIDSAMLLAVLLLIVTNIVLITIPDGAVKNYFPNIIKPVIEQSKKPELNLSVVLDKKVIHPGEKFTATISYKNIGKNSAKDVNVFLNINSEFYSGKRQIVWTPTEIETLKEIKTGESGEIKFTGALNTNFEQQSDSQTRFVLMLNGESQYSADGLADKLSTNSNKVLAKISTVFSVQAFSRYYSAEGEQLGRGPLPPVAGEPTILWLFLNAETKYNDVKNILVTAALADGVTLTSRQSATSEQGITYNENNRQITWSIEKLIAPSSFYPEIGVGFEVSFTPTPEQTGSVASLLTNIKVSGEDSFTGEQFSYTLPDITTKTVDNKSNGIVIKK